MNVPYKPSYTPPKRCIIGDVIYDTFNDVKYVITGETLIHGFLDGSMLECTRADGTMDTVLRSSVEYGSRFRIL